MSRRAMIGVLLAVAACGSPGGLELATVEPDVVSQQVATPVLVRGSGLVGTVMVDLDDDSEPVIDQGWRVRVGATDIGEAAADGAGNLSITVPAGLPLGTHDVVVTGPDGVSDTLSAALTVIDGDPNADAAADAAQGCAICQGGTCAGGCTISCTANQCDEPVVCPPGADCTIVCNGNNACAGGVDCTAAASCSIDCAGDDSCTAPIVCGPGPCQVLCAGDNTCSDLDCASSCGCEVSCNGTNACQAPATCPAGCQQGRGCTSTGAGCNTCP